MCAVVRVLVMNIKSPWFWLILVAVAVALVLLWRAMHTGKSSSVSSYQGPPKGPAPIDSTAATINAIANLGRVGESIFSDFSD